jgi:hypothetical protein
MPVLAQSLLEKTGDGSIVLDNEYSHSGLYSSFIVSIARSSGDVEPRSVYSGER